ncbi:MAG: CHAD domain-containing protein [Phycisphaerales bacterium]|nr:CHAD domain-containing protein [Phycisphaerales bacterium]
MPSSPKWMQGLSRETPAEQAAERVLRAWLGEVAKLLPRAIKAQKSDRGSKAVHELRVATRRASSAIGVFADVLDGDRVRKARRRLRRIRRAAGAVRDCDVHSEVLIGALCRDDDAATRDNVRRVARALRSRRTHALPELADLAERWPAAKLKKQFAKLITSLSETHEPPTFGELADRVIRREIDAVIRAGSADLTDLENVHEVRVRLKQLRYAAEAVTPCLGPTWSTSLLPKLIELQGVLGDINDTCLLIHVLERAETEQKHAPAKPAAEIAEKKRAGESGSRGSVAQARNNGRKKGASTAASGLGVVVSRHKERLASAHAAFVERWAAFASGAFFDELRAALVAEAVPALQVNTVPEPLSSPRVLKPIGFVEPKGGIESGSETRRHARRRIAAIDVGTNSVRLIVAEDQPDGSYRVLDDEKELTRLGRGLQDTGKMTPEAMEHTAVTVARMRSIAEGYQAAEIRVVGTAAAREAKNAPALARLIEERSGLKMQVISGEEEAMLAYRSAASAFDLRDVSSAVIDIGGGSTEIVLSAAVKDHSDDARRAGLGGGVIERAYTMPIGAVVLTEKFGGPEACSGKRFEDLRSHVADVLKERVGRPPIVPQLAIGTGGTLTTLAAMVKMRKMGAIGDGLFGSVQGFEIDRADVRHLIAQLRGLAVKDRVRVPGLTADRADIIVAGLVIVDAVMKRLEVNRLRVHEGGIRDGILLGMVRGNKEAADPKRDPMKGVRRFARACGYEAAHSKHVTGLALSIFDQLGSQRALLDLEGGMSFGAESRLLLEAAAMLHDIGYLINYAQHHKHSYHLIVHADLPGLTTRQVQVIANVARYHRAAEPKSKHRTLANLGAEDQALVRGLSGILRVADGLDRTHTQSVSGVDVKIEKSGVHIGVRAEHEPGVDMWGSARKSGLFQKAFGRVVHFEWHGGEAGEDRSARKSRAKVEGVVA